MMEFNDGIYKPVRVLFDTPIYERAMQICWHIQSFKVKVAVVTEMLQLQLKNKLPSKITVEDMTTFLVEESRKTLRVQLWEFELEDYEDEDVKALLKLVWEVNTRMLNRDVEFQAKRLLDSPNNIPPFYKHPKILSQAHDYARALVEQLEHPPIAEKLSPQEVVLDLVPKVLQAFWVPKRTNSRDMPSEQLSEMAVSVSKAVMDGVSSSLSTSLHQVAFPRSVRDLMVRSLEGKVRQRYSPDTLRRMLNTFEAELLRTITKAAVDYVCFLFQRQTRSGISAHKPSELTAVRETLNMSQQTPNHALHVVLPAPIVNTTPLSKAELSATINMDEQTKFSISQARPEKPLTGPGPYSARTQSPRPDYTPPAEPLVLVSVLGVGVVDEQPCQDQEPAIAQAPEPFVDFSDVLSAATEREQQELSPGQEPDSAVVTLSPLLRVTPPAEPSAMISVLEGEVETKQQDQEPEVITVLSSPVPEEYGEKPSWITPVSTEEPLGQEPDSASAMQLQPLHALKAEPEMTISVLEGEGETQQPSISPSVQVSTDGAQKEVPETGFQRFLRWLRNTFFCCLRPEEED